MYSYGYFQTDVLINFFMSLRGETHDLLTQSVIMALAGGGLLLMTF